MKYKHFSVEEREKIQELWWERKSIRHIAKAIGRSPSSITRELHRNFPPEHHVYSPRLAHERALAKRKCRGRILRLKNKKIRAYVAEHLKQRWSPEQIAGRMLKDIGERISHEAIYQFVYAHIHYGKPRPGYEDFRPYLRRKRKRRIPKGARRCQRIFKPFEPSIDERPRIVEIRKRIGDWEGDTVESCDHKPGINTLVERKTGFTRITRLAGKTSESTTKAVIERFQELPGNTRRTLTLDRGSENSDWETIEKETGIKCFFAHPYRSCERGTNENTNGLIRDYFPKKTDFTTISPVEIALVEYELNTRPRKRLGWRTPLEAFSVALQS